MNQNTRLPTLPRLLLAGLALLLGSMTASAQPVAIGSQNVAPAATLLLPYFEVDLANEQGRQTAIRLTNTSATAILLNVVLWTDLGIPTQRFNVYQQGYATTDIDLRLLFKGVRPVTASAGQDPTDQISPQGNLSQDINFASCNGQLPYPGLIDAATLTSLRNAHRGLGATQFGGNCAGVPYGDNIARGYVTIDLVNQCSNDIPGSPAYSFPNILTAQNVVTGTVTYTDRGNGLSFGEPLVHLEANPTDPRVNTAGSNSFYGRLTNFAGNDVREPLPSISGARYVNGGTFATATDLIVFRDPGTTVLPFACGGALPAPFPLGQTQIRAFNEQEGTAVVTGTPFPYVTQRVAASSLTNFTAGWIFANLTRAGQNAAISGRQQSYISIRQFRAGQYGGSTSAVEMNNAINPASTNFILGGN
jgi:hypothetical protein